mmetsp:Transcript_35031/g.51447  ORF Transcript_35031/g.51447 Transcript_35031/m.51447 type:complete len:94 (+) Transcript_35031:86-367(+)
MGTPPRYDNCGVWCSSGSKYENMMTNTGASVPAATNSVADTYLLAIDDAAYLMTELATTANAKDSHARVERINASKSFSAIFQMLTSAMTIAP